jgi:hypothetical protein
MFHTCLSFQRIALLIACSLFIISGCASRPVGERIEAPEVELISSSRYEFREVRVDPAVDSISIKGEVAHMIPHRGMVPGKIRIALIGADGQVLEQTEVAPMRSNRQDQSDHFYARLTTPPPAGSKLRIEHGGG